MDPSHVRCKDLGPKDSHVFEKLRRLESCVKPESVVATWLANRSSALPRLKRRLPLQEIEPSNAKYSSATSLYVQRPHPESESSRIPKKMRRDEDRSAPQRVRGRPRGRGRGGRGRGQNPLNDSFQLGSDTEATETLEASNEQPAFVLRPVASLPSSSGKSPTRSPSRSKTGSTVVKRSHLAFMTPAIRFVSHETATERGGLPPTVQNLWSGHMFQELSRRNFVPQGLQVSSHSWSTRV